MYISNTLGKQTKAATPGVDLRRKINATMQIQLQTIRRK